MHRRSPRALLLWSAAVAVALATAVVVATDLATLHRRADTLGPERAVAVAVRDLPVGTTIDAADLDARRVHASQLPPDVLAVGDVEGRVVIATILEDGFVVARSVASPERSGLDDVVPSGMRVVRVAAEQAPALDAGDAVDVLATFDPSLAAELPEGWDPTVTVARGALVIAGAEPADAGDPTVASVGTGVTLVVTEDEARGLAFAAANGVVTIALAPPEEARPFGGPESPST